MLYPLLLVALAVALGRTASTKGGVSRVFPKGWCAEPQLPPSQKAAPENRDQTPREVPPKGAEVKVFTDDFQTVTAYLVEGGDDWRIWKIVEIDDHRHGTDTFDNDPEEIEWLGPYIVEFLHKPFIWFGKPVWTVQTHMVSFDGWPCKDEAVSRFQTPTRIRKIFKLV